MQQIADPRYCTHIPLKLVSSFFLRGYAVSKLRQELLTNDDRVPLGRGAIPGKPQIGSGETMNRSKSTKYGAPSPLYIAELQLGQGEGCIGLTLCPGKKDAASGWDRDLEEDLRAILEWGATTVVTLIEDHEFKFLKIIELGKRVQELGMRWIHLPITDVSIPDRRFEDNWKVAAQEIHRRLANGEKILIHCRGGVGRSGLVAGVILVERGCAPRAAIEQVRAVRPGAIETREQERYVLKAKKLPLPSDMEQKKPDQTSGFTRRIPPAAVRERYQGCLLGGSIGDALGAPIEFSRRSEILKKYGPRGLTEMTPAYGKLGAITDDTQMTLFTAEGAMRAYVRSALRGICDRPTTIHYAYLRWLHTQGEPLSKHIDLILTGWLIQHKDLFARRAPGTTCVSSLRRSSGIGAPAKNDSKGCGGVMRVAPIGMMLHALSAANPDGRGRHFQDAFDLACDAAALTHGHPTGSLPAGVMAAMVFELLDGADLLSAIDRAIPLLKTRPGHEETLAAIMSARSLALSSAPAAEAIQQLGEGWVAEQALAIGIYCALKDSTLEEGIVMAVNHDGDSDSTGLIAGHLLGAMRGLSEIPTRWLEPLELRTVIAQMADDLATIPAWHLAGPDAPDRTAESEYYTSRYPGY